MKLNCSFSSARRHGSARGAWGLILLMALGGCAPGKPEVTVEKTAATAAGRMTGSALTSSTVGGVGGAAGAGAAAATGAAAPFAVSITATTVWISTVWPSSTLISASTPAAGDGISASTLSVEISRTASSRFTSSPTCLSQRDTVPSTIDSPI